MTRDLIRNLIISTEIGIKQVESLMKLVNEQPSSQYTQSRKKSIIEGIESGQTILKHLKLVSCDHKDGHTTKIEWVKDYSDISHRLKMRSIKQVTKKCKKCNLVFYRKSYNLMKNKKGQRVKKIK